MAETMFNQLKQLFPNALRQSLKRRIFHLQDMQTRLENLKSAGFQCTGAIDGGAYRGDWTKTLWNVWPTTSCLMIEPQPKQAPILVELAHRVPGSRACQIAIADSNRKERFSLEETNSRLGGDSDCGAIEIDVRTLDSLLCETANFHPNLLKLDLQGFELAALDGCSSSLPQFEVIILEVSILRIGEVPIFREVDHYLAQRGYRVYDLLPSYFRPRDGALWQVDAFYVRESSPLIASRDWA
jgi:FkbM family methyltransferase